MSSDSGPTARAATSGPSLTQQAGTASSTSGCTADAATSGPRLTPQASKTSSDSSATARAATSGPSLTASGPDELGRRLRGPCGDLQAVARAASRHGELGQRLPAPSRIGRRGLGQQLHGPRDDLRTAPLAAGSQDELGQQLHDQRRPVGRESRSRLARGSMAWLALSQHAGAASSASSSTDGSRGGIQATLTHQAGATSSTNGSRPTRRPSGHHARCGPARRAGQQLHGPRGDLHAAPREANHHGRLGQRLRGPRGDLRVTPHNAGRRGELASNSAARAATSRPPSTQQHFGTTTSASGRAARAAISAPLLEHGQRLHGPRGDLRAAPRAASLHAELGQRLCGQR